MSLEQLVTIIHSKNTENWKERNEKALKSLFGSPHGRYAANAEKSIQLRAPDMAFESGVSFAAYIHPNNPTKGPYGGFSFVIFPSPEEPALFGLVVGTQGLAPDEAILGRPGHARKAQAICAWLNAKFGEGNAIAWAKHDPTQIEVPIPDHIARNWPTYKDALERYDKWMYAIFKPTENEETTKEALAAFLDLMFQERGISPNTPSRENSVKIRTEWFDHLMPRVDKAQVKNLLDQKRFVVIQGPPGTGKTTMAQELLDLEYGGMGRTVQLHPNTTYETFIGGLAPASSDRDLGLQFIPKAGFLMQAAQQAQIQL